MSTPPEVERFWSSMKAKAIARWAVAGAAGDPCMSVSNRLTWFERAELGQFGDGTPVGALVRAWRVAMVVTLQRQRMVGRR